MRIAILSDLHANLEALEALRLECDELWVLGDLVDYGPDPAAVIDFVRARAALVVRGNHDDAVGRGNDPRCSAQYRRMAEETMAYTRGVLSARDIDYLASLPLTARRVVDGIHFFLCHAAPSDPLYRYLTPEAPEWTAEAATAAADVLLVGHTHIPFTRKVGGTLVVNPGSVGQPKTGRPQACFAVWDGSAQLREANYDLAATVAKIDGMPASTVVKNDLKAALQSGGRLP